MKKHMNALALGLALAAVSLSFVPASSLDPAADDCPWYIPNAFSPNNDGINDVFRPFTGTECQISDYTIRIFNRWGSLVFESNNIETAWDGTFRNQPAPQGVYLYAIQYTAETNGRSRVFVQSGEITLLR